jgi:LysM repeat protein
MNQKLIGFRMRKAGVFFLFFMMLATWSQASSPDSLRTRWINGKKYVLHKVAPKETFSSVSRKYNVTIAELQQANPGVAGLKIGQIINIPVLSGDASPAPESPSAPPSASPKSSSGSGAVKMHTVQKGETLYRISKMYSMTVDDLKALNGLSSNNVSLGQKLKVNPGAAVSSPIVTVPTPVKEPAPAPEPVKEPIKEPVKTPVKEPAPAVEEVPVPKPVAPTEPVRATPPPAPVDTPKTSPKETNGDELPKAYTNPGASRTSTIEKDPKTGVEVEKVVEVGVATWINENDLNQNKFYALHRSAPVGTIIKVTNRMNNNSVFVKVVGVLPETGDNTNVIIKITQAAAQRIGAIDQKFTAELSYGISK